MAFGSTSPHGLTPAGRLSDDRAKADQRVSAFLGSGWTGVAADRFADAWEDWKVAADQVRDGLTSMSELVRAVHDDLVRQDDASQARVDAVSARIVDRLG
ncbi:MAG: WXG100 family type VII secretion target [Nocardioides sp.]|uniref:WXG100 family type VII secretion target n=1 Tax=Nocardioides sp. TaxID=35761 RepID=UPI003EFEEDA4